LFVCVRELGQIYGSIQAQHQKTILLDFIDPLADYDRFGRADILFAKDKIIGAPLPSLHAVDDLPKHVQEQLYFVRFEGLIERPAACISHIYTWLGLSTFEIAPSELDKGLRESASHYNMKYTHQQSEHMLKPKKHEIPPQIQM
jgi:sulfotransferase